MTSIVYYFKRVPLHRWMFHECSSRLFNRAIWAVFRHATPGKYTCGVFLSRVHVHPIRDVEGGEYESSTGWKESSTLIRVRRDSLDSASSSTLRAGAALVCRPNKKDRAGDWPIGC